MTDQEFDRVKYQFDELIKTLILLASSAQEQLGFLGTGTWPGDEMAADFETYFTVNRSDYLERGLLTSQSLAALDTLDRFMGTLSGLQNMDFWCEPDALRLHSDWQKIRTMAQSCLLVLERSGFSLEVKQTHSLESGPNGEPLMITWTQTLLVPPQNHKD